MMALWAVVASVLAGFPSQADVERGVNCKDQTAAEGPCSIKYKVGPPFIYHEQVEQAVDVAPY